MDFFKKKAVQIIAWLVWILATIVLTLAGVSAEGLSSVLVAVLGVVSAIAAVITLIGNLIKKDKK